MIDFTETFDVIKDVHQFVQSQRPPTAQIAIERPEISLLGQERDGTLLYSWNDFSPYNLQDPIVVTHFAVYEPSSSKHRVVFVHEQIVKTVCATINEERTFLCFTTLSSEETLQENAESKEKQRKDVYKLFLAEIQPQSRVFSLNIDRYRYLRSQFIYGSPPAPQDAVAAKECHLVVQLHRESIGLYHIPFARAGSKVIMSAQPRTEQLQGKFVWSQWETATQRLYYLHFKKRKGHDAGYCPAVCCIQFHSGMSHSVGFELNLAGINIPRSSLKTSSPYLTGGLWKCIPDSSFNMDVISQPNGTLCICIQHPFVESQRLSWGQTPPSHEQTTHCTLEYSVYIVHHARTLRVKVPNVSKAVLNRTRMFFCFTGDYLLAHLPGVFSHLLNVSIELEPCNHLIYQENTFLFDSSPRYYTPFYRGSSPLALDTTQLMAYKPSINHDALLDLFMDTPTLYTRQAVIHYATVYAKDLQFLKKIVEAICNDPCSPENCPLLKEILLGSSYSLARKRLDRRIAKLLPYTSSTGFSGHCERDARGSRLAVLGYSVFRGGVNITDPEQTASVSKPTASHHDDLFANLLRHIQSLQVNAYPRFDPAAVLKEIRSLEDNQWEVTSEKGRPPQQKEKRGQSVLSNLTKLSRSKGQSPPSLPLPPSSALSRTDAILGAKPPFFSHIADYSLNRNYVMCQTKLKSHVLGNLRKDVPERIEGICTEYGECMMALSNQLCHLIWSVLGPSPEEYNCDNLSARGAQRDKDLFYMFETFWLAITELSFPLPPGFAQHFTKLAFRCLPYRLFLQYLDQGVLVLNREIVEHVIEDLQTQENTEEIISQLIMRLPSKDARRCLEIWRHPSATRNLAQKMVSHTLKEKALPQMAPGDISVMSSVNVGTVSTNTPCSFPPMAALLELLEAKDPHVKKFPGSSIDRDYLEKNALLELHEKCGPDLSGVNF